MTDREQTIATLTEHLNHWKRLLSEGICTKDEGERTINALTFAIDSIKVDRAYDLAYEKVDFIEIPEGATNGEVLKNVLKETFPDMICVWYRDSEHLHRSITFSEDWWNSPYRKEQE